MQPSRQAKSISRIRARRKKEGLCFECGKPSATFRCQECNGRRRDSMRRLMAERRSK